MSWLSKLTHTEGWTPDIVKKAGNIIGGQVAQAIPGGSVFDSIFNLSGRAPTTVEQLAQQTAGNLQEQGNAAYLAARQTGSQQQGFSQLSAGVGSLLSSPVGLVLLAVVLFMALRRK